MKPALHVHLRLVTLSAHVALPPHGLNWHVGRAVVGVEPSAGETVSLVVESWVVVAVVAAAVVAAAVVAAAVVAEEGNVIVSRNILAVAVGFIDDIVVEIVGSVLEGWVVKTAAVV